MIEQSPYQIRVSSAGDYVINWVKDSKGTRGVVVKESVVSIVKHSVPIARFLTRDNSCFIPGLKNHSIIIELKGAAPFSFLLNDHAYNTNSSTIEHAIAGPGLFELNRLRDKFCPGRPLAVQVREMPRVTVEGNNVVCEGEQSKIIFRISGGIPPYRLSYTDGSPEVTVSTSALEVEILAKQSGALVYATGLSDQYCYFGRINNV